MNVARTAVLLLGGLLLLPGACSLYASAIFAMLAWEYGPGEALGIAFTVWPLWLGGFALAGLGIWLIRRERRRKGK